MQPEYWEGELKCREPSPPRLASLWIISGLALHKSFERFRRSFHSNAGAPIDITPDFSAVAADAEASEKNVCFETHFETIEDLQKQIFLFGVFPVTWRLDCF